MSITIIPWIVVLIFGGIFMFAAVREILRRRAQGPDVNPRDAFDFDETAPSYEEPDTPGPDPADDPDGDHDDPGHADDIKTRPAADAGNGGSDPENPSDRPDRNEAPK